MEKWIDMCMEKCIDMCIDKCIDMGMDKCIDMCVGKCIDMCTDLIHYLINIDYGHLLRSSIGAVHTSMRQCACARVECVFAYVHVRLCARLVCPCVHVSLCPCLCACGRAGVQDGQPDRRMLGSR